MNFFDRAFDSLIDRIKPPFHGMVEQLYEDAQSERIKLRHIMVICVLKERLLVKNKYDEDRFWTLKEAQAFSRHVQKLTPDELKELTEFQTLLVEATTDILLELEIRFDQLKFIRDAISYLPKDFPTKAYEDGCEQIFQSVVDDTSSTLRKFRTLSKSASVEKAANLKFQVDLTADKLPTQFKDFSELFFIALKAYKERSYIQDLRTDEEFSKTLQFLQTRFHLVIEYGNVMITLNNWVNEQTSKRIARDRERRAKHYERYLCEVRQFRSRLEDALS